MNLNRAQPVSGATRRAGASRDQEEAGVVPREEDKVGGCREWS